MSMYDVIRPELSCLELVEHVHRMITGTCSHMSAMQPCTNTIMVLQVAGQTAQ